MEPGRRPPRSELGRVPRDPDRPDRPAPGDLGADPAGWILVAAPLVMLPGFFFPIWWVPGHIAFWVLCFGVLLVDAPRFGESALFWLLAMGCFWPAALLFYARLRAQNGAPDRLLLVGCSSALAVALLYLVPLWV